ncbi:MAG: aminoacyl-tRNA hydrolase [Termitinemataceae bacterium]|nr:MAG: aminoacyl-tRNA hydrolase [Termitinemataceae bacterium]
MLKSVLDDRLIKSIKLIAFLGNPGDMYKGNRHNAGRLFVESLGFVLEWQKKFKGLFAVANTGDFLERPHIAGERQSDPHIAGERQSGKIFFLIPETFMNLCGQSVEPCVAFYKIKPPEILVVHDELELELGVAAFKAGGGLSGHNGLRSIKAQIGSADFLRLRIGIGRPGGKKDPHTDISSWVLSNFTQDERETLSSVFAECSKILWQI